MAQAAARELVQTIAKVHMPHSCAWSRISFVLRGDEVLGRVWAGGAGTVGGYKSKLGVGAGIIRSAKQLLPSHEGSRREILLTQTRPRRPSSVVPEFSALKSRCDMRDRETACERSLFGEESVGLLGSRQTVGHNSSRRSTEKEHRLLNRCDV